MPIASYLAYPKSGRARQAAAALAALPNCAVTPSSDQSLLVVVTDTPDDQADQQLRHTMRALPDVDAVAMVFCHEASDHSEEERS